MPLLDHFRPPVGDLCPWESFYSGWATHLMDLLYEKWLPSEFRATEHIHARPSNLTADLPPWSPPPPTGNIATVFPDTFEVRISSMSGGATLVGAIELISPGNKDRPKERRAFAARCASYLYQGISLVIIDIVTSHGANLRNETMRLMGMGEEYCMPPDAELYAVAYRPVLRDGRAEIDLWTERCAVGSPLPVMPLRLTGDHFVPVDFEAAYQETCRRRRIGS